jgi:geranylgeranyl reductase family protein
VNRVWDLAVVGAGPAGTAAALGALHADPGARVLLLDREDFPRDKTCGDGVAPHVLDVLASVGVSGVVDDWRPVRRLALRVDDVAVEREMSRPARVVPRAVLDARLLERAVAAGAHLVRHRVRSVRRDGARVALDGRFSARVVVGADGAHSVVRRAAGLPPVRRRALALRGYAPVTDGREGRQVIVFGRARQPSYAWSFDRGDGLANVGYGELLDGARPAPSRADLLARLEELLPGAAAGGTAWRAHHLPLSSARLALPAGRLLPAGDAAGLVNPMTGEGIYYAVATGVLAGRSAVAALAAPGAGARAGVAYASAVRALLRRHLAHTDVAAHLVGLGPVVRSGVRAAADDQRVFDDLVEVGLGRGTLTPRVLGRVAAGLSR